MAPGTHGILYTLRARYVSSDSSNLMPTRAARTPTVFQRLLLGVSAPIVFVLLCDVTIRISGIDTDVARNENFEIGVPVWLLGDENWVDIQRGRLETPRGVRASDLAWLRHFEEARYVEYKLKPDIDVAANNPFNDIELQRGKTFRITSNSVGFRTGEFGPKTPGVTRIVTLGDSSTFGWGVEPAYTYQHLLEQRLVNADQPAEVLNLGISGHTSRHGLGVYKHYARELEPDWLIVSYGANDARFVLQAVDGVLSQDDTWRGTARDLLYRFETFKLLRRWILGVYDPFDASRARAEREGNQRELVRSVPRDVYIDNLRSLIGQARQQGTKTALLAVCALPEYVSAMRQVADAENVVMVDALDMFQTNLDDLRAHRIYPDEVRFYEALYGMEAMENNWRYYVTTDGCHPGRAGHSLLADALHNGLRRHE